MALSKSDEVILKIEKIIGERVSGYVGKTTVPDLMAIARRIAAKTILQVFKAEGLDSITLGKLPEGEVFLVVQDEKEPTAVRVLLQGPLRRLAERGKVAAGETGESD